MSNDERTTECIAERSTERSEVIRYLAEWLGWANGEFWIIHDAQATCPYDTTEGFSLIVFAAYVKAELAKRGWATNQSGYKPTHVHVLQYGKPCRTDLFEYDPNSPLSEAGAILLAADEVRRMEREGEG